MRRRALLAACVLAMGMSAGSTAFAASSTYTVRAGDTLSAIAHRYDTTVAALERANGLGPNSLLRVGEVLDLPGSGAAAPRVAARSYVVRAGDTLSSIARSLGVSVSALEGANGLTATSVLQIGEHLRVPGASGTAAGATKPSHSIPAVYVVKSGDTLSSIARRFGVSLSALYNLNGMDATSVLQIGQRLRLPGSTAPAAATAKPSHSTPVLYVVKSGDTLSSIARRFGIPLSTLYSLNGMDATSVLQIGQHLRLRAAPTVHAPRTAMHHRAGPFPHPHANTQSYKVQPGDTLSGIAARLGVSVATLQQLNPSVNPSDLQVGVSLVLPGTAQAAAAAASISLHDRVAAEVQRFLGVPYVWGGASPSGFDCSGLVQYVFGQLGISIPRDATDQYYAGQPVASNDLQPGDVLFFDTTGGISHDGIYIGNGHFVDAPTAGQNVQVENLYSSYWQNDYIGARWFGN